MPLSIDTNVWPIVFEQFLLSHDGHIAPLLPLLSVCKYFQVSSYYIAACSVTHLLYRLSFNPSSIVT
jgi:hypothetical protein